LALFYLETFKGLPGSRVLEIGPSSATTKSFINPRFLKEARYSAIDVRSLKHHRNIQAPHEFMMMDATRLEWAEKTFDLVLCNHVLPYIEADRKVLAEIHRVLKEDGVAVLNSHTENRAQTLRMDDLKKENPSKYTDEFLVENGTVWEYGQDYFARLQEAGFALLEWDVVAGRSQEFVSYNGLKPQSRITLGFKTEAAKKFFLSK
jgi:ubiquinone/menaquinone biosynthesis C-methylase UbiE